MQAVAQNWTDDWSCAKKSGMRKLSLLFFASVCLAIHHHRAGGLIQNPIKLTTLYHVTNQEGNAPPGWVANAAPTGGLGAAWAFLNDPAFPTRADDPNFDGTLGDTTQAARPRGFFAIAERPGYEGGNWYPRGANLGGRDFWRVKIPIGDTFSNLAGANPQPLDSFTVFACFPQGSTAMFANPVKLTGRGNQLLLVLVHPDNVNAFNAWKNNNNQIGLGNGMIYVEQNKQSNKYMEYLRHRWTADKVYLDGPRDKHGTRLAAPGTINLFIVGTYDLGGCARYGGDDVCVWDELEHI